MRRERIEKKRAPSPRKLPEILPLDPRDPDILRAKEIVVPAPPRRRAA